MSAGPPGEAGPAERLLMLIDNAALLRQELPRLERLLGVTQYGTIGVAFTLHAGLISKITRTEEVLTKPSGAGGRS